MLEDVDSSVAIAAEIYDVHQDALRDPTRNGLLWREKAKLLDAFLML